MDRFFWSIFEEKHNNNTHQKKNQCHKTIGVAAGKRVGALVYDVFYQLYEKGKVKRIVKSLDKGNSQFVNSEFMWID